MLPWFAQNIFTILIIAVLVAFFGWLIYTIIRDKKQGRSSCCGGCAGCAMAGHCHPNTAKTADVPSDTADTNTAATKEADS